MKKALLCLVSLVLASAALAVTPGTELYLPSVGHGQGSCPGGICAQWRSDAWIYNPGTQAATVTVYLLVRGDQNSSPQASNPMTVNPGETKELLDAVYTVFNQDNKFGALRFVASAPVVVTGRVYDANVVTNKGTGTAGQFFAGLPASAAFGKNGSSDMAGLAQDKADSASPAGDWRSSFGFVEVTGNPVTVQVQKLDGAGTTVLATQTYTTTKGYGAQLYTVSSLGGTFGLNQRLHISVTDGTGKIVAFASRIDNRTGDPSTVEMSYTPGGAVPTSGRFEGSIVVTDPAVDGGLRMTLSTTALTDYAGVAGIICNGVPFTLDFGPDPGLSVPITNGTFVAPDVTIPYTDTVVFHTTWSLSGTRASDGTWSGTLTSKITDGTGAYAGCNGTVAHTWRAGWTGNS